jgi:hypothetical protein
VQSNFLPPKRSSPPQGRTRLLTGPWCDLLLPSQIGRGPDLRRYGAAQVEARVALSVVIRGTSPDGGDWHGSGTAGRTTRPTSARSASPSSPVDQDRRAGSATSSTMRASPMPPSRRPWREGRLAGWDEENLLSHAGGPQVQTEGAQGEGGQPDTGQLGRPQGVARPAGAPP